MPTSVNDIRTVPVQEDLVGSVNALEIQRGIDKMHRADKPVAAGESLVAGEFAVLGNDGNLSRPGVTPVASTFLVFAGTDRFDSRSTGKVTVIENSAIVVKTSIFDDTVSYNVGDYLTAKDLGAGEAKVSKAAAGEWSVGRVTEVGSGYLVYDLFSSPMKA